jgi:hypothetical protein
MQKEKILKMIFDPQKGGQLNDSLSLSASYEKCEIFCGSPCANPKDGTLNPFGLSPTFTTNSIRQPCDFAYPMGQVPFDVHK